MTSAPRLRIVASGAALFIGVTAVAILDATPAAAATCAGTAASDFNGDGIADAAIGEPGAPGGGAVHILYGTRSGMVASASGTAHDDQLLSGGATGTMFGYSVAAVDFNGDGCSDLAVGDPWATAGGFEHAGSVHYYWGDPVAGLKDFSQTLDAAAGGGTDTLAGEFGTTLAAGEINGDTWGDLVVGAVNEDNMAGAVYVFSGDEDGPGAGGAHRYTEGVAGVPGSGDPGDAFSRALATGDFNGDGRDDVAIGAPGEDGASGQVYILRGASSRSNPLTTTGAQVWSQDSSGIPGASEDGDQFGSALATGGFKGNGRVDLAIGVPYENFGTDDNGSGEEPGSDCGMVNVIYSAGSAGLSSSGSQGWTQDSAGVPGRGEMDDNFGVTVAAGDFNGNGRADLAIGAIGEALGDIGSAGSVTVLPGASSGLTGTGSKAWTQDTIGIAGVPEPGDAFGFGLTTLRVKSSSRDDLLVGVFNEAIGSVIGAGMMHFIPGSSTGLTATGSQGWNADTGGVRGAANDGGNFGWAIA